MAYQSTKNGSKRQYLLALQGVPLHSTSYYPSTAVVFPLFLTGSQQILFCIWTFIIIERGKQVLKMTNSATLSERLQQLRGLIADHADTTTLLLQADKLISLDKHLHSRRNDTGVDALQQQSKALLQKLKQAGKDKKAKEDLIASLQRDLDIMAVKCRNLEERLQHQNLTSARERRKETRVERRKTGEIGVQAETLSPVVFENLVRNYRSELAENDRLRIQLQQMKDLEEGEDTDGSVTLTDVCCDSEVEMQISPGASYGQTETETARQVFPSKGSGVVTVGRRQTTFDLICSVSSQLYRYFKDQ